MLPQPLMELTFEPSASDQKRLRSLSGIVASIEADLLNRRIPGAIQFDPGEERSGGVPFLQEMETIVSFIPQAFAGSRSIDEYLPSPDDVPRPKWFAPRGLLNPEYHKFALKGCLAATACYVIYNSVAWPGISTAVTTCLLTALSTIGASRQKQILRFAGAIVGGFVIGMGSQIFILPHLDTIGGFTVLFMVVTALASWVMTSSPRLSYFGLQVALAYYLINLQEFKIQTSLAVARDRVAGVMLGLFMMWLVFDQLWSAPAGVEMKRRFVLTFRLLAQLAREPVSTDIQATTKRTYALRESIDDEFNQVRSSCRWRSFRIRSLAAAGSRDAGRHPALAATTAHAFRNEDRLFEISLPSAWFRIARSDTPCPASVRRSLGPNARGDGRTDRG